MNTDSYGLQDKEGHPLYIERMGACAAWLRARALGRDGSACVCASKTAGRTVVRIHVSGGVDSGSVCKIMNEDFSIMRYIHHQEQVMHLCREVRTMPLCALACLMALLAGRR